MREFEECTNAEKQVLDQIAEGRMVRDCDPIIVQTLREKNLVAEHEGIDTIPAIVWNLWKKYKEETGWKP